MRRHLAALGLLLGAVLVLAGSLPVWIEQTYGTDHSRSLSVKGSQLVGSLVPMAVVALAGLAACYAVRGVVRRSVGVVLAAVGVVVEVVVLTQWSHPPDVASTSDSVLPVPRNLLDPVRVLPAGPLLAVVGGALIAVAGLLVIVGVGARRMAARFDVRIPPGDRNSAAPNSSAALRGAASITERSRELPASADDPDSAVVWWKALDAGTDPTAPPVRSGPPGSVALGDTAAAPADSAGSVGPGGAVRPESGQRLP